MRAIDADAFMDTINRNCYPVQHDMTSIEPGMTQTGILQAIQEQPTIEPRRKKGKWIDETFKPWGLVYHPYKCDQCGEHSEADSDFCPNCGADMREDGASNADVES